MLDRHLIAHPHPAAAPENIVTWGAYRVSVLQDRLFRLERSETHCFRDAATQSVWFRDMPPQHFCVKKETKRCTISTAACTLILHERREDCRIVLNGKKLRIGNKGNLFGTYRTLDLCDGNLYHDPVTHEVKPIALGTGVCSVTGIAVFDDAASLTLGEDGQVRAECGDGTDEYIFAYGHDYRAAVRALYAVSGNTPLIPRYALGNWWSRYYAYTDRSYLALLKKFEDRDVPLTVATIDMDWHYSTFVDRKFGVTAKGRDTEFYGGKDGWTGYTWNEDLFPDWRAFLQKVHEKNLKITLNLHPAEGIRWWEECYPRMAAAMGIEPATYEVVRFDIADPNFVNHYFSLIHKPYELAGVDFWWIDWQQGTRSDLEGLDPLWALNHYHTLDHAKNHALPLILSRYAGIGSHRYPIGFSGDSYITWETLRYLPYFTLTASNVGYTWWSHDIGGHMCGETDGELYLRHVQFGVFSPINRLHCSCEPTVTKEPWAYGNGTGAIAMDFLRLRHRLIPFLYTMNYCTHTEGKALIEPLYYQWDVPQAYSYRDEYLFGGLLVAPVTQKLKKDGYARVKVWLPHGRWTDIFTGDCYVVPEGGEEKTLLRRLESIPVLAPAGTILPFSMDRGNCSDNPHYLRIDCYAGNGKFHLYEDGGEIGISGEFFTEFTMTERFEENIAVQSLVITSHGDEEVISKERKLEIRFADIFDGTLSVFVDGLLSNVDRNDDEAVCAAIAFAPRREYRLEVRHPIQDAMAKQRGRALHILTCAEGDNEEKARLRRSIAAAKTQEEYLDAVDGSRLSQGEKMRLKETLSATK